MSDTASTLPPELQRKRQERLTRAQAAEYLGVPEHTLANWAHTRRKQLAFYKIGRRVFYKLSDLDLFLNRCKRS
jgi:excisionase family DNA binding protein